jgi:hypothetical protein
VRYRRCFWREPEKTLVEWVLSERLKGNKVSTTSILLKARLAEENKVENFKAYPSWAFSFMRRNNLCTRSTSSVGQKLPDDWEAKVEKFRLYVKEISGDTSTPEIEDHEESTSENELSDVPEEIINVLHSFDCDSDEDFFWF